MEKVKIPAYVGEFIEEVRSKLAAETAESILYNAFPHNPTGYMSDYAAIGNRPEPLRRKIAAYVRMHRVEYFKALVNGYEKEDSPRQKVIKRYEEARRSGDAKTVDAIRFVAESTNHKYMLQDLDRLDEEVYMPIKETVDLDADKVEIMKNKVYVAARLTRSGYLAADVGTDHELKFSQIRQLLNEIDDVLRSVQAENKPKGSTDIF